MGFCFVFFFFENFGLQVARRLIKKKKSALKTAGVGVCILVCPQFCLSCFSVTVVNLMVPDNCLLKLASFVGLMHQALQCEL